MKKQKTYENETAISDFNYIIIVYYHTYITHVILTNHHDSRKTTAATARIMDTNNVDHCYISIKMDYDKS